MSVTVTATGGGGGSGGWTGPWVAVVGDISDGFKLYGPFGNQAQADLWMNNLKLPGTASRWSMKVLAASTPVVVASNPDAGQVTS